MICPICEAKNVTVAHILGHGGAGKTKGFSNEEKQRRRERMKALNAARSAKKTNASDLAPKGARQTPPAAPTPPPL
jgi:hypothetical protein